MRRTQKRWGKCFLVLVAVGFFTLSISLAFADDWGKIFGQIQNKYTKFDKEIKNMTTVQKIKMITPGREIMSDSKMFKKGNKFRMETTLELPEMPENMGAMSSIVIYDGVETWMISSMMGKQQLTGGEEKQYQTANDWWASLSDDAEVTGTETIGSFDCYIVEMHENENIPFTRLWIDKKTLVLIKSEGDGPGDQTVQMLYSDFKKVHNKWAFPYQTEIFLGDKLLSVILVESIETNKELSDDLFDPEKVEIKGPSLQDVINSKEEGD